MLKYSFVYALSVYLMSDYFNQLLFNCFFFTSISICSLCSIPGDTTKVRVHYNVYLTFNNPQSEQHCLSLYNMMGHKLREINDITANRIALDREELHSGIYFVVIEGRAQRLRAKLIIN